MASPPEPSLFSAAGRRRAGARAPLAERLRPARLEHFVDVDGLLAEGAPLRREVEAGRLPSLVLHGSPGCGKTTLARLLATVSGYDLTALSAVSSGVAALREAVSEAELRLGAGGRATALFVDEIHRLDRRQQDALLHAVEDGRVALLGATTENPGFHVTAALRSRCRIVRLPGLDAAGGQALVQRALTDAEQGLGGSGLTLTDAALAVLLTLSAGDGRRLLNTLEQAAGLVLGEGTAEIGEGHVRAAAGRVLPLHDRAGDAHFDLLSALHKSLRGGDPDAAAYYVQRLLVAGEDPRVVARRLVRMASEDVGLADPRALGVALDALRAVEFLGLPEGDAALVQAAVYLALAPRSDAVYRACGAARAEVQRSGALPVPSALRNAPTAVHRAEGHGVGYVNPHDTPEAVAATEHLPDALRGKRFYVPGPRGAEVELGRRLEEIRRRRDRARRGDGPDPGAAPPGTGA